jgi:hypothetical protein
MSIQASAADCALIYLAAPKLQLDTWTVVGFTAFKFKTVLSNR